ncbi:MAG TPA: tRNA (adenosine(37)-N6)-threonylcarbamoyltransferase complex dimerization subunit type 1 TsaB [Bacillota bacterium]
MLILGIDTATPWGSVALAEEGEIIFEVSLKAAKGSGEYLISLLERLFQKTGRRLDELNLIAAGVGPGSYTGIRVGLATVTGLTEGLQIPAFGINTLRIIAENAHFSAKLVAAALEARHGEVYGALYRFNGNSAEELLPPRAIKAEQFATTLADWGPLVLCGDGGKHYRAVFEQVPGINLAPRYWDYPRAGLAAQIAGEEWPVVKTTEPPILIPEYLKRVEAEIRLEEKRGGADNGSTNVCRGSGGCTRD